MYAMEYEKGLYHHSDEIRVKDRAGIGSNIRQVFRMYENKALVEDTETIRNVTKYFGAIKNIKGEWIMNTDPFENPEDLDSWWDSK